MLRRPCDLSDWSSCQRCSLSLTRRNVVLRGIGQVHRGTVWRDNRVIYIRGEATDELIRAGTSLTNGPLLLFIGEAPGDQEDATGLPFQGQSGRVFNLMLSLTTSSFQFEITNVVACRPSTVGKYGAIVNRTPSSQEIEKCMPRLYHLITSVKYEGIVYLGSVAKAFPASSALNLTHPAAILRKEYKLYDLKKEAKKLDHYVSNLLEARRET